MRLGRFRFPKSSVRPVSQKQREALLGLIGIWKTDHPPSDDEVERIIEEARMKKYAADARAARYQCSAGFDLAPGLPSDRQIPHRIPFSSRRGNYPTIAHRPPSVGLPSPQSPTG